MEQTVDLLHQRLLKLDETLADISLYEDGQQQKLQTLLQQQKILQREATQAEQEWLEAVNALEEFH